MRATLVIALFALLVASCASNPDRRTLARLHDVPADVEEVEVADSLDRALESYKRFLEETPSSVMTPEAMRRLADLKLEQQFGLIGDGEIVELPADADTAATRAQSSRAAATRASATGEAGAESAPRAELPGVLVLVLLVQGGICVQTGIRRLVRPTDGEEASPHEATVSQAVGLVSRIVIWSSTSRRCARWVTGLRSGKEDGG